MVGEGVVELLVAQAGGEPVGVIVVSLDTGDSHGVILVSWRGLAKRIRNFALAEFWKNGDQPKGEAPSTEPKQGK